MRLAVLDYDGLRRRRFERALRDFFRRWGLYAAVAIAVFGAGSNAPLTIAAAAAAWLLWPLRSAIDHGAALPATIAYALAGALPVVGTRQLWWPRHWAEAERALPLSVATLRRSDRRFATAILLPWQSTLAVGWLGVFAGSPSPPAVGDAVGVSVWLLSAGGSLWLSTRWMRRVRRIAAAPSTRPSWRVAPSLLSLDRSIRAPHALRLVDAASALVLLPLVRGRATRSTAALVIGTFGTSACAAGPLWPPVTTGWSLALLSFVALVATSWLRACTVRELQPLWRANPQLPLPRRTCDRARVAVVLLPAIVGAGLCLAGVTASPRLLRPRVLVAFGLVLVSACTVEATTREAMEPTHHAARWVLLLSIAVAFASEVTPP